MIDPRDALAELAMSANKEQARLQRLGDVNLIDELRFRIWPFLHDLTEATELLCEDLEDPGTVPVDTVARAVGLILTLAHTVGRYEQGAEYEKVLARAQESVAELLALCDPDEIAAFTAQLSVSEPKIVEEIAGLDKIAAPFATPALVATDAVDGVGDDVENFAGNDQTAPKSDRS